MRLELDPGASRVLIDLRATGPLAVLGHDPTLTARPAAISLEVSDAAGAAIDVPVELTFAVTSIEPPAGISSSDREKMRENLLSHEVLDAGRYPTLTLRARYAGTLDGGTLSGDLVVKGSPRRLSMNVRVARDGERLTVSGRWDGKLTDLGVKPFKALLGALRLEDWAALRLEARFAPAPGAR
jgi:polyisoprenoid-binding protein YceI